MKVSFFFFLAFAVILLAVSAQNEDESKAEPKLGVPVPATRTEEKKEEGPTSAEKGDKETLTSSPETKAMEDNTTKPPLSKEERCRQLTGKFVDGKFEGEIVQYDVQKLLEKYGGAPGKVNATWTEKEDAPVEEKDLEKRPLPDADDKYRLYKYGDTDYKTYIRIEHAVRRFSGTPKAFLEVRGQLYFTPDDYCGKMRRAEYAVDDRGFTFEVKYEYCWISDTLVSCAAPASCTTHAEGYITCIAAPSHALLAALVGGGK